MDTINNICDFLEKHQNPTVIEIDGRKYCDKELHSIVYPEELSISTIEAKTLTAIKDYLENKVNGFVGEGKFIITVNSPNQVALKREVNRFREYSNHMVSNTYSDQFRFDFFMDSEKFIIELQTNFVDSENLRTLQKVAGSLVNTSEVGVDDDGIKQNVTVKSGVALKQKVTIENPVYLKPYRTFPEIEQPTIPFVFRVSDEIGNKPYCALFESSSKQWEIECIQKIKDWFKNNLDPDMIESGHVVIIG